MGTYPDLLQKLIKEFSNLPGIGEKSALRITLHIIRTERDKVFELAKVLMDVKDKVRLCPICFNLTDKSPCQICDDPQRIEDLIMVVEGPGDLLAMDRAKNYKGKYHVLHGALSPIHGIGPDELRIKELVSRLKDGKVKEVIIATNPNMEGEATALYLKNLFQEHGLPLKLTRIAQGVPMGGDLEYIDEATISKSLEGRREI